MIFNLFSKKKGAGGQTAPRQRNIVFPRYHGGEFETLADAVQSLMEHKDTFHLGDIMQYNVRYRDYLREHGIDELVELMLREAPALRQEENAIKEIYNRFDRMGQIARYDIQCYDITKQIPVLGKESALRLHRGKNVEWFLQENSISKLSPFHNNHAIQNEFGLHLGQVYENYPCFDSSDWSDDRSYRNYFIRTSPINTVNSTGKSGCSR